jgi:hypothetical protein
MWGPDTVTEKTGLWRYTAISWDVGSEGANGGGPGKRSGRGQEGAKYRGVRGVSTTPKKTQGELGLLSQRKYCYFS